MAASTEGHGAWAMQEAARQYVEHVRGLRLRERAVAAELESARDGALRAASVSSGPRGAGPDHGDDATFSVVARMQELAAEWEADMAELADEREEFHRVVSGMADPRCQLVLTLRVECATWEQLADRLGCSVSTARRQAGSAYVALWPVMPERWRALAFPDCI